MVLHGCAFETERLHVQDWHADGAPQGLAAIAAALLTEPVTRSLPEAWHGDYTRDRAQRWIAERDHEGVTLIILEKATREAIGLVILFEVPPVRDDRATHVRLGYLFGADHWGKGFASELVAGFARWCRGTRGIGSITGGVPRDNPASARVLTKNGFRRVDGADAASDEDMYRLTLPGR